ncbi:MAG: universal stress protein [Mucilaginibacter sp.]
MNTILIATDFSVNAHHAATYGYHLAQQLKAKVLLCYVMNLTAEIPQTGIAVWPADVYDDFSADANGELAKLRKGLIAKGEPDAYQPEVSCIQDAGLVTDVLNEAAAVNKADLIVIGIHGNDKLDTLIMGNHSRKMIEESVRPLLLVPVGTVASKINKIAFACDFTEPEKDVKIIEELAELAKALKAELILAHVYQRSDTPGYMLKGKQLADKLIKDLDYAKISFAVVSSKDVEDGLGWLVRDIKIDMLAMVHREHGFFEQLFKGSFTQKAARQLTVPLLVFKPVK